MKKVWGGKPFVVPEDERIRRIGEAVMSLPAGKIIAFITDDEPDKPERYLRKLQERYPQVVLIDKQKGPVPNVVTVRVRR